MVGQRDDWVQKGELETVQFVWVVDAIVAALEALVSTQFFLRYKNSLNDMMTDDTRLQLNAAQKRHRGQIDVVLRLRKIEE
jgi:beta-lactamase regulating signal transducer with metallopeptidase domain